MELYETYLEENTKFEFVKTRGKNKLDRYISTFVKILNDAYIITIPKINGNEYKLKLGEKANLHLYTPEGIFNFAVTVVQIAPQCAKVRLTDGVIQTQRRNYARAEIPLPVRVKIDEGKKSNVYDVTSINMCAQGMNFHVNSELSEFGKIQVKFVMKNRLIQTFAKLAYCNLIKRADDENDENLYSCGLNFTSINQLNANFLAKECFSYEIDKKKSLHDDGKDKGPVVTIDVDGIMTI